MFYLFLASIALNSGQASLADELQQQQQISTINQYQRTLLTRKCGYLLDEDSSPDSDRLHSLGDVDSGHSTAHSPNDLKSLSPQLAMSPTSQSHSYTTSFGGVVIKIEFNSLYVSSALQMIHFLQFFFSLSIESHVYFRYRIVN